MKPVLVLCLVLLTGVEVAQRSSAAQRVSAAASRTVTTRDGVTLHCLESGSGPAILFVPGWTMPAEIFEPQLAHFGPRWRAVSMDPRGHGRSSKPTDGYDLATRARDIRAVIEGLGLAPVVLVGWSNGATEAAAYIDQFGTDGLAGVVFVDGTMTPMYFGSALSNFGVRELLHGVAALAPSPRPRGHAADDTIVYSAAWPRPCCQKRFSIDFEPARAVASCKCRRAGRPLRRVLAATRWLERCTAMCTRSRAIRGWCSFTISI